ncbi:MAG: adenosylcobinamide-phosphate synthase, partial [Hyphomicrobiaceae bacterium]
MSIAGSLLIAMLIEGVVSWPVRLHAIVGHPVTWLGRLIATLERWFNRDDFSETSRKLAGVVVAFFTIALAGGIAWAIAHLLPGSVVGMVLVGLLAWPLIASRSMYDHVAAVAEPLVRGNLGDARAAVAMIVGRDPNQLDGSGITRAALESLAENTSDGIIAPLFWGLLLGLPGIAAYKAINTLDSMIGHRTLRYEAFGWAAARIDDVANLVPARLTGLLFVLVSGRPLAAWRCMLRDARQHRSPNAGWPEAA